MDLQVRLQQGLLERGLPETLAETVARELEPRLAHQSEALWEATLDGVAVAHGHLAGPAEDRPGQRELQELERLMGCFAGELNKLDEVLEVLAATLQRMRSQSKRTPPPPGDRLLH